MEEVASYCNIRGENRSYCAAVAGPYKIDATERLIYPKTPRWSPLMPLFHKVMGIADGVVFLPTISIRNRPSS